MLLAVYLVGSAAGAAGYQRWLEGCLSDRDADADASGDRLLAALAAACLARHGDPVGRRAREGRGAARASAAACRGRRSPPRRCSALLAFGPPTIVMGALFSHLSRRASAAGVSFGRALGVNTLGAAAAPARLRRARGPRARAQARAAADRRRLSRVDARGARGPAPTRLGCPRRVALAARALRAAARLRRRPRGRSRRQLPGRRHGRGERGRRRRRRRAPAHQQPAAGGQQRHPARRRPAGVAAAAAASRAPRARCSWVSAPASRPSSAAEDPDAARSTPSSSCPR